MSLTGEGSLASSTRDLAANPFSNIYASDAWTMGSGPGSLHAVNRPFIDFLTNFIHNNDVHSIVDFGCGDWQYMKSVDLSGVRYLGLDVVDDVLSMVRKRHGRSNISFARTPENLADIPEGDLIIFKDVLIHLGNSYVATAAESSPVEVQVCPEYQQL